VLVVEMFATWIKMESSNQMFFFIGADQDKDS